MKTKLPLILILLLTMAVVATAADNKLMQVRLYLETKADFLKLPALHLDQVFQKDNYIEVVADEAKLTQIKDAGIRTEIVHDDIVAFNRSRLIISKDMGGYKTLDEINTYIDAVVNEHSNTVAPKLNIGYTLEGRPMWAIKVSDNPTVDEDEPEILFHAAIHSREVITPEVWPFWIRSPTTTTSIRTSPNW